MCSQNHCSGMILTLFPREELDLHCNATPVVANANFISCNCCLCHEAYDFFFGKLVL
jgi:hypothetical protein